MAHDEYERRLAWGGSPSLERRRRRRRSRHRAFARYDYHVMGPDGGSDHDIPDDVHFLRREQHALSDSEPRRHDEPSYTARDRTAGLRGLPLACPPCRHSHVFSSPLDLAEGATEFLLAMGLEDKMAGTAYLDDSIWPRYADAYANIPVLSSSYPTEHQIMAVNADFIMGSYRSAFREQTCTPERCRGIFTNATVGPCDGANSDWFPAGSNMTTSYSTCRPQLHAYGIGTWLEPISCEDSALKPSGGATEETVYAMIRQIGAIFDVRAAPHAAPITAPIAAPSTHATQSRLGAPRRPLPARCACRSTTWPRRSCPRCVTTSRRPSARCRRVGSLARPPCLSSLIHLPCSPSAGPERAVQSSGNALRAVWLDCVGCCSNEQGTSVDMVFAGGGIEPSMAFHWPPTDLPWPAAASH